MILWGWSILCGFENWSCLLMLLFLVLVKGNHLTWYLVAKSKDLGCIILNNLCDVVDIQREMRNVYIRWSVDK